MVLIACCFTVISGILFGLTDAQSGEQLATLKATEFNGYNTKVRPVTDQSTVTAVTLDFALVGINNFDDADQKLTTTGYLTAKWTDELITWTPASHGNITSMLVPQNEIWRPDITLDNGMDTKQALGQKFIQVTILSDGAVTWTPYEVFDTSCSVDIVHFPFDRQVCDIRFVTWMNEQDKVTLAVGTSGFYTHNFEKNGKWKIETMTSYAVTEENKSIVGFQLSLKRKPSFYVLFLILPAILLSILNAFVFVLPAGSGEKIGYAIAVFLSYALFYTILSESLPKNSDKVSTVAAYLFFMMFLSVMATIVTILELRVYNKESKARLPMVLVHFVKCLLYQKCLCCKKTEDFQEDYLDGGWTKVIGPWIDCDWKDFIDALDFVLFWVFLIGTAICTILAIAFAAANSVLI